MTTHLFDLSGRVALVSGAASGMGRAMSLAKAEHGADVMLTDLNTEGMENTADRIRQLGRRGITVTCDVSQPDKIRPMFARLDREFGRIDFLGNVASEGLMARPADITLEQLQTVLQNLVIGRFCMCNALALSPNQLPQLVGGEGTRLRLRRARLLSVGLPLFCAHLVCQSLTTRPRRRETRTTTKDERHLDIRLLRGISV